jgi:hypothetical protein
MRSTLHTKTLTARIVAASLSLACVAAAQLPSLAAAPPPPLATHHAPAQRQGFAGRFATGAPPPTHVCDTKTLLTGPSSPPSGAVTVAAGDDSNFAPAPNTTYWFAPGTHTLGAGQYAQIMPADGDTFIGAPGAVIDGGHTNLYAFTQHAVHVTIEYLTIQNFGAPGDNEDQGVVNHDAGHNWVIQRNTIEDDAGAGVFVGSNDVVKYNCLRDNGQYGFSAYEPNGVSNVLLEDNEIAGNDTDNWERRVPGCGCTGGGKFWDVNYATVTGNWVHANKGPGLWADTDNNDFDIENNVIADNRDEGLIYEISYNARIAYNTFTRNALGGGPKNPGFPTPAIYLSESGGDSRLAARYTTIDVTANKFVDNWAGVVLWENADRFCNSPANSSSGYCTLVNPKVVTLKTCVRGTIKTQPYYADCRWKTQNVAVDHNAFSFAAADIPGCAASVSCGFQGLFSNYGTYPNWSPYKGEVIERAITFKQHDVFSDNAYTGPWLFMAHDQGTILSAAAWQAAPYDQDAGSTFGS